MGTKCIELNSEFVIPQKNCVFGLGLGPDPKPKTHRDPSQNVCT